MTNPSDVDLLLDRWLAEGVTELSDRVLDTSLDIVEHTHQRRVLRLPWRTPPMTLSLRLAAAALVVVVVAAGAYVLHSTAAQVAQSPGPSLSALASNPVASAVPTPRPTPAPNPTPRPTSTLIPGTSALSAPTKLSPGTTYSTGLFDPAFTLKGQAGWWYLDGGPGSAWLANGPNEPNGPDTYSFSIVVPARVIAPTGQTGSTLPTDLVAWLQADPDLSFQASQSITVGTLHGTALVGVVKGAVGDNLMCPAETHPCSQNQGGALGFSSGSAFKIIVIPFSGQFLVIGMQGPSSDWATDAKVFDPLLSGLAFPGLTN